MGLFPPYIVGLKQKSYRMRLHTLFIGIAAVTLFSCQAPESENATLAHEELGYQVYTIRENLGDSAAIDGALASAGEMGFTLAESFGWSPMDHMFLGISGANWNRMLHDHGQHSVSGHYMPLELLGHEVKAIDSAGIPAMLDAAEAMGQHWVIIPWMMPEWVTAEGAIHVTNYVNTLGRQAKKRGMRAAYHNHDFEFQVVNEAGQSFYDLLLAHCDPRWVDFEMDLFWVAKAGQDPLRWFAQHPGRFVLWHVKDMDPQDSSLQVPVGQGQINWTRIFAAREQAGMQYYFIEQDECQAGKAAMECLKESSEYAKASLNAPITIPEE